MRLQGIDELLAFATHVGQVANKQDVLLLTGDLGAGKTTFTKGIAKGLGIEQMIKSPTYTIIREYESGRLPLYHMDVYRVISGSDELGLDDYFEGDGLTVVEWGRQLEELPLDFLEIILTKDDLDDTIRHLTFKIEGVRAQAFYERIMEFA
ncbi:tRNA (adenosine(37)-N6)-threonylcarbamoyltransferase complex ATPase subunit type 1 TsaE [Enterococcus bulliens]